VCCDYNVHSFKRSQVDTLARRCTFATFSGENLHKLNSLARQVVDSWQSMGTILDIQGEISKVLTIYSTIVSPLCFLIDSILCLINKIPFELFQNFNPILNFLYLCATMCNISMFGFMDLSFIYCEVLEGILP
jgi:hypothetical protein